MIVFKKINNFNKFRWFFILIFLFFKKELIQNLFGFKNFLFRFFKGKKY